MRIDTNAPESHARTPIPTQLAIVAWRDSIVDALGFPPHDPYSELTGRGVRLN